MLPVGQGPLAGRGKKSPQRQPRTDRCSSGRWNTQELSTPAVHEKISLTLARTLYKYTFYNSDCCQSKTAVFQHDGCRSGGAQECQHLVRLRWWGFSWGAICGMCQLHNNRAKQDMLEFVPDSTF